MRRPRQGDEGAGEYADIPGFCMSAPVEKVRENKFILTPCRYVGAEVVEDDGEPFDEKMKRLNRTLHGQFIDSQVLDSEIRKNLRGVGYEV